MIQNSIASRKASTPLKGLRSFITIGWLSDLVFLKPCRRVTVALADDVSVKVLGRPQADNVVNINSDVGNPIIDLWCSEMMITVQNTDTLLSHIWPSELSDVGMVFVLKVWIVVLLLLNSLVD